MVFRSSSALCPLPAARCSRNRACRSRVILERRAEAQVRGGGMVHDQQETARLSPIEPVLSPAETTPPDNEHEEEAEPFDRRRALTFARELVETVLLTLVIFVAVR